MLHTLRTTLTVVLVMLYIASPMVLAAADTLSGTVQNVDPQQGRLTLRTGEEHIVELRAPAELLTGLPERRRGGSDEVRTARHIYSPAGRGAADGVRRDAAAPTASYLPQSSGQRRP